MTAAGSAARHLEHLTRVIGTHAGQTSGRGCPNRTRVYLLPKCEVNIQPSPSQIAGERRRVGEHPERQAWRYGELGLHERRCRPGYEGLTEGRDRGSGVVTGGRDGNA